MNDQLSKKDEKASQSIAEKKVEKLLLENNAITKIKVEPREYILNFHNNFSKNCIF